MKRGQVLGVAIAGISGVGAFIGVLTLVNKPATVVTREVTVSMAQVLVAKTDIGLGQITGADYFRWQDWPQTALSPSYILRSARPNAVSELTGAVARTPLMPGEPITAMKLVKAGEGGVLAAILPAGMRAISTRIKEETGVGKMILPNDHVDVLLTTRKRGDHAAETLFRNVRVLAIGQLIEAREGKKLAEGNTATLELTPAQAEELAAANARGEISLVLRSIADIKGGDETMSTQVKILRYGGRSRSVGAVN
ncbi:MAG: Flp pilus assembly protein CpaB [Hyphomonadaceae bacterium]|jgi:pilus assembly protein CpaB|nr:Flp pilus assembly protein CpaB [Hyphomonadaceae bacterium]